MQDLNDFDDFESSKKTVNFGDGIEFLMNDRKKSSSPSNINIDLGELDRLEEELNDLNDTPQKVSTSSSSDYLGFGKNLFNFNTSPPDVVDNKPNSNSNNSNSNLGNATANTNINMGHQQMNDMPFESGNRLSEREKRRKKRMMIKKLEEWHEKGLIRSVSNYTTDSSYEEIEDEYEGALEDKRRKDSIKVQGWWFMTFVNSIQYANSAFDPFDINLDGWSEQVNEDLDAYDEIFSELHQKYKGGKISPEISLLLRLGFSASVVNFTNKALSSAVPGFNDVIKQSPELMKVFTKATVDLMSQQSPGFNFANNMMDDTNTTFGKPPPPVETKMHPPSQRTPMKMQYSQRPDISAGRGGSMFREEGVDMNRVNEYQRSEMRGPQNMDMNKLFPGLKKREEVVKQLVVDENDSMISISSMKEMMSNKQPPRRAYKRKSSEKNTISLDI